jgi:hypothetical protein
MYEYIPDILIFLIELLIFSVLEKQTRLLLINSQILNRFFFFFQMYLYSTVFVYQLNVVDECSVHNVRTPEEENKL